MRLLLSTISLVGLVACAVWLQGCGLGCTLKGYPEGFHLHLQRPAWEPADYRIEGETETGPFACTFGVDHVVTCSPATVRFGRWNGSESEETLVFSDHPKAVAVAVYRNGELLGTGAFVPHYRHAEPNGEGCGEQIYAAEKLELPGPAPCGVDDGCRCVYADGCGCGTDDLASWPWSVCQGPTLPASSCTSDCACVGQPPRCVRSCDGQYPSPRALCVDGTWSCADPAYPVSQEACPGR